MATLYASADAVRARAASLDPVKVLVALVGLVPFLVFFAARVVWFLASLLIAAGMEGWDAAGRRVPVPRADGQRGG
jgi:hypothetical protein